MAHPAVVNPGAATVNEDGSRFSDDALATAARDGDPEGFTLLYHRYKLDVWNLAVFKLGDHHDAEDAVQETFLKAYRSLGRRRSHEVRPWLLAICRNVCLDRLRARGRRRTVSLDEEDVPEPASPAEDVDLRLDFRRALARLPAEEVEAFFLVDVLGCRSEEAARIVGLRAASTLRSRLARARRELAPAVADWERPDAADSPGRTRHGRFAWRPSG